MLDKPLTWGSVKLHGSAHAVWVPYSQARTSSLPIVRDLGGVRVQLCCSINIDRV